MPLHISIDDLDVTALAWETAYLNSSFSAISAVASAIFSAVPKMIRTGFISFFGWYLMPEQLRFFIGADILISGHTPITLTFRFMRGKISLFCTHTGWEYFFAAECAAGAPSNKGTVTAWKEALQNAA